MTTLKKPIEPLPEDRSVDRRLLLDQRDANEHLVRAAIRAQELAQEAAAAQKRAEERERRSFESARFREMFIGILGHDLRNPLTAIGIAAGGLLRRGRLDGQDAEAAARILRTGERINRMIGQLLDVTRARLGGGLSLEAVMGDLGDVCRVVVEEFPSDLIRLELGEDLTGVWDLDRLAELLSNIAGNALEHAAPDTVVVVRARGESTDVVVEISNQGAPIPADVLPFIFEPFRRAKGRERSKNGNLGLGLYIASQVVSAHGGTLEARSAEGTTTFSMRLPRAIPTNLPPESDRPSFTS